MKELGAVIILTLILAGYAWADSGPLIREDAARAIAQDYLNQNGYDSYRAVATGELLSKVKYRDTGDIMWIDAGKAKRESMEGNPPYDIIIFMAHVINVADENGRVAGKIYVNGDDGKIVYKDLPEKGKADEGQVSSDSGSSELTYEGNGTQQGQGGILDSLNAFIESILKFFQSILNSLTGGG
ncbi:hypothetical protein [Methanothermobacter sp. KEPCO 2]|uniref:hypothetical protein n=1 Tax=Methanothermobacter sp. KEPCO 2 TaxID=3240977 RepID=UPI0035172F07